MARVGYLLQRFPQLSQTFVSNEVRELRAQGMTVDVVALAPGDDGLDPGPDAIVAPAVDPTAASYWRRTHPIRWARFLRARRRLALEMGGQSDQVDPAVLPTIARELERRGVTSLHAHFAWHAAAAAMCVAELLDVPWSVTLHANDIFGRLRNLEPKLAGATHLVTVCEYNRRWLLDHHRITRPLSIVVCGVDVPPASTRTPEVDVVAVGRLVPKKGFDVLVDAAAQLHASRPDLRVEIVGEGPQRDALEAQIRARGLDDVVVLRGAMSHDATLERIAAARVFTLPCRVADNGDRDSMPVVIKEAMAREVPVVATDVVAVPEMVDESCGVLVPEDDAGALAAALDKVLGDPDLATAMGVAGRARVEERFTLSGEVAKLKALFEELATCSR
jgi:glycosyltransferase involved in cell wall biosynthesis